MVLKLVHNKYWISLFLFTTSSRIYSDWWAVLQFCLSHTSYALTKVKGNKLFAAKSSLGNNSNTKCLSFHKENRNTHDHTRLTAVLALFRKKSDEVLFFKLNKRKSEICWKTGDFHAWESVCSARVACKTNFCSNNFCSSTCMSEICQEFIVFYRSCDENQLSFENYNR